MSKVVSISHCAAGGCRKRHKGKGYPFCDKHLEMYETGKPFKDLLNRTVLKKEFQK
jgi:hypothetical protein